MITVLFVGMVFPQPFHAIAMEQRYIEFKLPALQQGDLCLENSMRTKGIGERTMIISSASERIYTQLDSRFSNHVPLVSGGWVQEPGSNRFFLFFFNTIHISCCAQFTP